MLDFSKRTPKSIISQTLSVCKNIAVIGSGPSLDYSLDDLKELSKTHIIVCGGSNYRVLLSHGIEPDFLTLVERADDVYDTYKAIYEEFGQTKTKLVISSTCYDKLADLFVETSVFYRPALTPAVLYAESMNEVITHEGPQAVCAALSFAINFQPSNLVLVGGRSWELQILLSPDQKKQWVTVLDLWKKLLRAIFKILFTLIKCFSIVEMFLARIFTATTMGFKGSILNASNGLKISGANACEAI